MPSLPEMVESWREAPEASATIELCNRLVRQSSRPGQQNVLSPKLVHEIIDESLRVFGDDLEVMLALGGLCLTVGLPERAEEILSGLSDPAGSDPRVAKLLGKVRLHLGVQSARSNPPMSRSSRPASDRSVAASAVLADLNRRIGTRGSGGYGAVAAPPSQPASPPAPQPTPRPAPPSARGGFELEDFLPPEEGEDASTMAHTYSPQELLAAIERDEAEVDDRAATRAREVVPSSERSAFQERARTAQSSAPPGHWSQGFHRAPQEEDTASFDSSDLLDEIQPTGFRRARQPPPSAPLPPPSPRPPMESLSEQPTAAKFEWQRYLEQDAPTRSREAPASAQELLAAIEEEATGHDGPTAMRDHWDGSTMSMMTREGPTAAIRQPLLDQASASAAAVEHAARELEAMDTGDGEGLVDYGAMGDELDEVEVVLPNRAARRHEPPVVPREEDPFEPHLDPNAASDHVSERPIYEASRGIDLSDEPVSSGSVVPEHRSPSQRSGELGFALPPRHTLDRGTQQMPSLPPEYPPAPNAGLGAALEAEPPWSRAPAPRVARGGSGIKSVLVGFLGVVVLVVGGATLYFYWTAREAAMTEPAYAPVDRDAMRAALLRGDLAGLDEVDRAWTEAGPTAMADVKLNELRLHERALRVLEFDEPPALLERAVADARKAGVDEGAIAFADLILATRAGDGKAIDRLISTHDADEALRADALYQFAVGVALERRGDENAIARFQNAVGSEPGFKIAEVRLIRAMLLYGDTEEGERRAAAFRDDPADSPRARALRTVAALVGVGAGTVNAQDVPALEAGLALPFELRWVPAAASYARERSKAKQVEHWTAAFEALDVPMSALLLGDLALAQGMEDRALAAADHALATGQHPRVLRLLGKAALQTGRLDRLAVDGDNVAAAELRVVLAYEKGDFKKVADIARAGFSTPGTLLRLQRMQGQSRLSPDQIDRLRQPDVVGGELVLIDAALDAGDLELARKTMSGWNDAATHPLKSRRWARLLRYEGDVGNASVALDVAAPVGPSVFEKVLVAAEIEVMQKPALETLDPLSLPEGYFLQSFLLARQNSLEAARAALETVPLPEAGASLSMRLAAALALSELRDPRGKPLCEELIVSFPRNPDALQAAEAYGIGALDTSGAGAQDEGAAPKVDGAPAP